VLVHDAARPCLTAAERDALLDAVWDHEAGGLLALPLADTLKQADALQQVSATLPRQALWRAQTPQMFRHGLLVEALQQALARGERPTDEAQAIEALGYKPLLVVGRSTNLKVTSAADLPLAQALLTAAMECA
jgi:2-C-methyl-D-erythritol 4-phosphate cytidylyltransferase